MVGRQLAVEEESFLSCRPVIETTPPCRDALREKRGHVSSLAGVSFEIEEFHSRRTGFDDEFPTTVAQAGQRQRIIGEKQRKPLARIEQRCALVIRWNCHPEQIKHRW